MQESGSEGSESPNRLSGKRDRDDGEDTVPFKKRVRFLGSDDLKEVTNDDTESSDANNNDVKVSSTSGVTDPGEENKMEIIPTQKRSSCTTCNEDDFSAPLSQLPISESGGTGSGQGGAEQSKADLFYRRRKAKQNSSQEEKPVQNQQVPEGESDFSGDGLDTISEENPIQKTEGDTKLDDGGGVCSPIDTTFERKGYRSGEDECQEEVQNAAITEVGEMTGDGDECKKDETAPEGKDDGSGDAPAVDSLDVEESHVLKDEGCAMREDGADNWSSIDATFESKGEVRDDGGECKKDETAREGHDDGSVDAPIVVSDDEHIPKAQEAALKDVHDEGHAPTGEEPSKYIYETIDDGDASGKDKPTMEGDGGGNCSFSPINTITESDGEKQGNIIVMEEADFGTNSNNARAQELMEGEDKTLDEFVSSMIRDSSSDCSDNELYHRKQSQEPERVTKHVGGSSGAFADTTTGSIEGGSHEQGEVAEMEDGGNENIRNMTESGVEEQSNKGKEPMETDHHEQEQRAAVEDGDNENVRKSEPQVEEQRNKGKEPVEEEDDDDEQGQRQRQTAIEEGGDGNAADVVVSGEESNQNAVPDIVGNKEQLDHQGTNPDADGGSGNGPPVILVSSDSDHNDGIQQAEFEDTDGEIGNKNIADGNSSGDMAIQGGGMQTEQDPMTTVDLRKRTRSIYEEGEVSHNVGDGDTTGQEARKKCKHDGDGGSTSVICLDGGVGVGNNEPPIQQDNHSVLLVDSTIPSEQEHDVAIINIDHNAAGGELANGSPPMQQPSTDGVQLFGVYITDEEQVQPVAMRGIQLFGVYITEEEQVESVEMQNGDRGSSHGGGESSMQRPKCGLRLFGFDI